MPAWINLGAVPVGQAGIEGGDERILVHVTADDAQARHAVARLVVPNLHDLGVLVDDLLLLALGRRVDKQAVLHQAHLVAGLLIGTVLGVALFRGVPVGPLIAAGLVSLLIGKS